MWIKGGSQLWTEKSLLPECWLNTLVVLVLGLKSLTLSEPRRPCKCVSDFSCRCTGGGFQDSHQEKNAFWSHLAPPQSSRETTGDCGVVGPHTHYPVPAKGADSPNYLANNFFVSVLLLPFIKKILLKYNWFSVALISAVQQSDTFILFHVLFHLDLSQGIDYISLCYTVGPCCLSILYIIVCIC